MLHWLHMTSGTKDFLAYAWVFRWLVTGSVLFIMGLVTGIYWLFPIGFGLVVFGHLVPRAMQPRSPETASSNGGYYDVAIGGRLADGETVRHPSQYYRK